MRKKDAFDAKIVNMRLTKIFSAIFAPDERLPSSATLSLSKTKVCRNDIMEAVNILREIKRWNLIEDVS